MKTYAKGIWFNKPSPKAPTFVIGRISIGIESFIAWLKEQKPNEKGYVNIDVLEGRDGKPYLVLNEWKKESPASPKEEVYKSEEYLEGENKSVNPADIPF